MKSNDPAVWKQKEKVPEVTDSFKELMIKVRFISFFIIVFMFQRQLLRVIILIKNGNNE